MVVQHNMQAMNANRMLNVTTTNQAKATEKLSSGYKINRAADDAAGLSISEKMRKQIRGLDQASTNAQDGISAVQTAEGALNEVHSMLQRMNELAVQAANGTNSESDRQAIQNEITQLETEIDRVAETTKFNETYLLKGNGKSSTAIVSAKDAGLAGKLKGVGTGTATFTMTALKYGDSISIGSKGYTIGTTVDSVRDVIKNGTGVKAEAIAEGSIITINGTEYKIVASTNDEVVEDNLLTKESIADLVKDTDKVIVGTQTMIAMTDANNDGIGDNDGSVVSAKKAYNLIADELRKSSSIGADAGHEASVSAVAGGPDYTTATQYTKDQTQISFKIDEGDVQIKQGLQMGLHVGADADGTNKISFTIDTMDAAGLGIKNLNLMDTTGAKATYAIDAIAEALAKVSAQRSELGAIQNRLEHTIANLDNVVENTTSAESQIRDTDMAEEMVEYSKNNILAQAGQSMLAQANQATQGVMNLLG
ncbi:MAG: flagellin [Lachnospiraceae bacterium]|nr:flagellin [Lachnospiraceae bacterium]MDY5521429.1 flagellin [Agathobacter sp.]